MRNAPIFRDSYEVTEDDLVGFVAEIKKSDDDIVVDAILRGRKYTGFTVTKVTNTSVNIGQGRLWQDGKRFYMDDQAGQSLDIASLRPELQRRVVLVVAYGEEIPDDLDFRDYETDAETGVKEPRQVKTVTFRHARIEAVGGGEGVDPTAPVVTTALTLARIVMDTGGIVSITQATDNLVANLDDVNLRLALVEDFVDETGPKISSITTDLARLQAQLANLGNQDLVYSLAGDVAEIRQKLELPAAYVNYRADFFLGDDQTDRVATGARGALTGEGLRFAPEAINEVQLQILNPFNADVTVKGSGLMLPTYSEIISRPVRGAVGQLALNQYAYETRSLLSSTMGRQRIRYGAEFEVSTGSAYYLSGTVSAGNGVAQILTIGNETFQSLDTGKVDADGHKIVRLAKYWTDSVAGAYWQRITNDQQLEGYAFVETWLNPQDGWLLQIDPRIWTKPASGLLYVGICETTNNEPDLSKMLALVSADATYWKPQTGIGGNKIPIPPTFLEGGKRYGYVLMTSAAYSVEHSDAATSYPTGTLFYGINGGVFQSDPLRHMMFDLYFAKFDKNRVEVDLQPLSLSGGISSIDITAAAIVPGSCSLTYEVQIAGVWRSLAETTGLSLLADLPVLLPFRAVLIGTGASAPGLTLAGSRLRVSRPKTTLHHVSSPATLKAPSSTIKSKLRLRNFDTTKHTAVPTLLVGAGYATVETADAVVDVPVGNGVIERTATFNLAAPVTSYKRVIDATALSASALFVTDAATDIAL